LVVIQPAVSGGGAQLAVDVMVQVQHVYKLLSRPPSTGRLMPVMYAAAGLARNAIAAAISPGVAKRPMGTPARACAAIWVAVAWGGDAADGPTGAGVRRNLGGGGAGFCRPGRKQTVQPAGGSVAGQYIINCNPRGREFARQGFCPAGHRPTDGVGNAQSGNRLFHRGGNYIDDATVPGLPHARQQGLDQGLVG